MEIPLATEALDPLAPSIWRIHLVGPPEPVLQSLRHIEKWRVVYLCQLALKCYGNLATAINAMQAASSSHQFHSASIVWDRSLF